MPFGYRLLFSVLMAGLPAVVLCLVLLWVNEYSLYHKLEGTAFVLISWLVLSFSARTTFTYSIQVLSNVVASLKEEDFSVRATQALKGDSLGELAIEINTLATALEDERLGTLETASLLRKVMAEAGAAILTFSPDERIHLINRAAAALLGGPEERLLGRKASDLEIEDLLNGPPSETITRSFGGIESRWLVRRTWFRQHGIQHRLVVLSEVSEALRAEERMAWQRLIRVLSHEINNSLAPIKSIARTLGRMSSKFQLPAESHENLVHGLEIIGSRADSLNRFLQSYTELAKLPPPRRRNFEFKRLAAHVAGLEHRVAVTVRDGPDVEANIDPDQIQNTLINLVKNAAEAVLMKSGPEPISEPIIVTWKTIGTDLEIAILDRGVGLSDTKNLFVPFYTTKETGTGIGLLLCRQIVENHGGRLTIRNRQDTRGCEVVIRIPGCIVGHAHATK